MSISPNSYNLRAFAVGLYMATWGPQAVLQVVGDSINESSSTNAMGVGWRDNVRLPWNGWTIHASNGVSTIGFTNFNNGSIATVTMTHIEPGTARVGASANVCPVRILQAVYTAGAMGANKVSDSDLKSGNLPWVETPNYVTSTGYTFSHRHLFIDGTRSLPSAALFSARNNSGVGSVVWTKPGSPTGNVIAVDSPASTSTAIEPSCEIRGNSAVSVAASADTWLHCGSRYRVTNVSGVHWNQPISFGGWNTDTHLDTTKFTDAALQNWYTITDKPSHIVLWLGANQNASQIAELNAGVTTLFKAGLLADIQRHEAAIVAAGGALPRVLMISQYKVGYSATNHEAQAQAMYELAQTSHRYSFLNLYELAGGASFASGTYTADGIHPNAAGITFLGNLIDVNMRASMVSHSFRWSDPGEVAWAATAVPSCYIASSANVRGTATGIEFFDAPCRLTLHHRSGDYCAGDAQVSAKFLARTGTADELVLALGAYNALNARINVNTGALTIRRGTGTTLASGSTSVSVNDLFTFRVTGGASSRLCEIVRGGVVLLSATDTSGLQGAGVAGVWSETVSAGGILKFSAFGPEPLNADVWSPPADSYRRHPHNYGVLITTANGESDAQGQADDRVWNPTGNTADWEGFLRTLVDPMMALGVRRFTIRGPFGNASDPSARFGHSTHSGGGASSLKSNILDARYADYLRDTARSGLASVMSDGRLLDGFQTALAARIDAGARFVLYGMIPPNGINSAGSLDGRTVWPGTAASSEFWHREALNLGCAIGVDSASSLDYDTGAFPTNAGPVAHMDWLRNTCPNIAVLEPHMIQGAGGTLSHGAYWIGGFDFISIADPVYGNSRFDNTVDNPAGFYGREDLGPVESSVWVSGSYVDPSDRLAKAKYALTLGWTPWVEQVLMTSDMILELAAAAAAGRINPGALSRVKF